MKTVSYPVFAACSFAFFLLGLVFHELLEMFREMARLIKAARQSLKGEDGESS